MKAAASSGGDSSFMKNMVFLNSIFLSYLIFAQTSILTQNIPPAFFCPASQNQPYDPNGNCCGDCLGEAVCSNTTGGNCQYEKSWGISLLPVSCKNSLYTKIIKVKTKIILKVLSLYFLYFFRTNESNSKKIK